VKALKGGLLFLSLSRLFSALKILQISIFNFKKL